MSVCLYDYKMQVIKAITFDDDNKLIELLNVVRKCDNIASLL